MAGEKVLVVEDNETNMELATALLEAAGYVVLSAVTAEEGIKIAKRQFPHIILMDISLPGMDGLTATGILKEDSTTGHIPVIALTAHAMRGDETKALSAGCSGYVSKPIDTRAFAQTVAGYILGHAE